MKMPKLTCNRCLKDGKPYQWIPRSDNKPVRCPQCGSPYWDRERTKGVKEGK